MSEPVTLLEYVSSSTPLRIDRDKGIIYGVKILGERSTNAPPRDNEYPKETREKAIDLIEGARVCIDHPDMKEASKTRSYKDGIGVHRNVQEKGDGLYGDFHFNPKHPLAEQIFWDAENAPQNLGFSINADGRAGRSPEGRTLISEIVKVYSVDLVSRPATTVGLFESESRHQAQEVKMASKTVKQLIESLKPKRPGYAKALLEMAEAGLLSNDAKMDEPAPMGDEVAVEADHKEALKTGFRAAVMAVLDDESLDMAGKAKKIKDILASWDKLVNDGGAAVPEEVVAEGEEEETEKVEEAEEEETDKEEVKESKRGSAGNLLEAKIEHLTLQLKARDMLADADIKRTGVINMALEACKTEGDVRKLIESVQAERADKPAKPVVKPGVKPKSAAGGSAKPIQESAANNKPVPTDPREFAKFCKN